MSASQILETLRVEAGATPPKARRTKVGAKADAHEAPHKDEAPPARPDRVAGAKRRASRQAARLALVASMGNARRIGIAAGAVSTVMVALSLNHLATAFAKVTACSGAEGYAMAVGIDLGFMVAELALITGDGEDKALTFYAKAIAGATLAISAATNAMMFSGSSDPVHRGMGIALGVAVPALIFGLNQVCARKIAAANRIGAQLATIDDAA